MLLISITLTGCDNGDNNTAENKNIIEELSIEEGCYSTDDSENLMCFTEDLKYYDVLYKNGKYYKDPYYMVSPPTEEQKSKFEYDFDDGLITIDYYDGTDNSISQVCSTPTENTIDCTETYIDLGKVVTNKKKYTKVKEKFNKDIIEKLPIYERNKEYVIDFNGKQITCNLTRNYSILRKFASSDIKNCLEKNLNKTFTLTQLNSSDDWQIYTEEEASEAAGKVNGLTYIMENYSYSVTVNDTPFKYYNDFPIDPYNTNDKMIVKIVKK